IQGFGRIQQRFVPGLGCRVATVRGVPGEVRRESHRRQEVRLVEQAETWFGLFEQADVLRSDRSSDRDGECAVVSVRGHQTSSPMASWTALSAVSIVSRSVANDIRKNGEVP